MIKLAFSILTIFSLNSFSDEVLKKETSFLEKQIYPVLEKGSDLHSGYTFLAGALASVLARPYDDEVRSQWKDHQKISKEASHVGDLFGSGLEVALVATGQYFFDPNESNYQSQIRGLFYGTLSVYILKTAFGRKRPGESENYQSFPSGHTMITFMAATQLSYAYGWQAGVAGFSIAAFTAGTRLSDDAHWFSDTVAGAFLGYLVGRATYYDSSDYQASILNPDKVTTSKNEIKFQVIPVIQNQNTGVSFYVSY